MQMYLILAFITYFTILLLIGVVFHKKQKSSADFVMGNRSLNFWLVALSAHASDMSAWLFMAFPMTVFLLGVGRVWIALGLLIGMFLNWQFVAPKLRSMTEKYDSCTMPSFFERRFNDTSGIIRLLSAAATLIFLIHYLSAGLIAMGILLESLFGIEYFLGLSIAMLVVVIYTFIGGFTTVAYADFFQGVFLLLMILIVPVVAFNHIGGWDPIIASAAKQNISLSPFMNADLETVAPLFLLAMGWGLGYFGMPHIVTKFMGIRSVSELKKSQWLGMSWQLIALSAAAIVGVIGLGFFEEGLSDPQLVFINMVKVLFHPFFGGIILCAIIAANMSTMDSQILVCASIMSEDLYKHFFKDSMTDKKVLLVSRFGVLVIALISLMFAFNKSTTILDTVSYAWSGLGSSLGPLVLMSLYSKSVTRFGAIAGILTGCLIVFVWPEINPIITDVSIMPIIPGFFGSLAAIYFVSMVTKNENPLEVCE